MLTRLKVNGFKNLVDVDVRFGPFTCIVGENGAGKSGSRHSFKETPAKDPSLSVSRTAKVSSYAGGWEHGEVGPGAAQPARATGGRNLIMG